MIAARQIAFGRGAGKRKPYDAEVEYLESTGKQWIDTEVEGDTLSKIGLTASGNTNNMAWLGCGESEMSGDRLLLCSKPTTTPPLTVTCRMDGTIVITDINCESATVIEADIANQTLTANGVASRVSFSGSISDRHVYLFAANYGSPKLVSNGHRIYSVKFYNLSGSLVRDFIPVRKGTVGYMYDRVSGKLFGNAGTGDFVLGPDLIDYTAKDYVQDGLVAIADGKDGIFKGGFVADYFTKDGEFLSNSANIQIPNLLTDSGEFTAECVVGQLNDGEKQNAYPFTFSRDAAISTPHFAVDGLSDTYTHWRMLTPKDTSSLNYQFFKKTDIVNQFRLVVNQTNFDIRTNSVSRLKGTCFNDGSFVGLVLQPDSRRCVRIYNRVLTDEEAAHNDLVDKARFGL